MKSFFTLIVISFSLIIHSQEINIIPKPAEIIVGKGIYTIKSPVQIVYNKAAKSSAEFLSQYLDQFYKIKSKLTQSSGYGRDSYYIMLMVGSVNNKEEYELKVDKYLSISGNAEGVFRGIQTLIQLLPLPNPKSKIQNLQIPQLTIKDYPRFYYRGMHLDVARHFFPVSFVKKYIDYLALHKFNYFHWHLTEDQGWRIEIKKYPKLTEVGAWRNGTIIGRYPGKGNDGIRYGGFYTQEEIKEVVKYAADRYITVVPEIELPGHSSAAIASYPELSCFPDEPTIKYFPKQCTWFGDSSGKQVQQTWGIFDDVYCAGKENTFKFLQDVMDEVLALFPSKYIHVGGDECPKENWKRCPNCQKRIKDEGLKDEHELQSYFIQRMEKYLNSKGRTLIGWDEILEGGLAPNAVVMSWRGEEGGIAAAKENHDVIMTPGGWCYFDHTQSENEDSVTIGGFTPIEKVYSYEPVPKELNTEQAKHVLGAQGNVWTEYMKNTRKVEYMVFPRMSALSEVLWTGKEKRDWNDFEKRLLVQFKRYDLWKANYSKAYFDLKGAVLPTEDYNGVMWKVDSKLNKPIIINFNNWDTVWVYAKPQLINRSLTSYAYFGVDNNRIEINQKFSFNKATGKKITLANEASKNYPGDGAFTLVNGVQNEKGLARSREFLGFLGTDCEAVIDLGAFQGISSVTVHALQGIGSWIWAPASIEAYGSVDNQYFSRLGTTTVFNETANGKGTMTIRFDNTPTQFVKIVIKNKGIIPEGNPGASNKAWLFVDEIEIDTPSP